MRAYLAYFFLSSISAIALEPLYVTNYYDEQVFRIDPITGASSLVATVSGAGGIQGFQVDNPTLGYTVGFFSSNVYSINLGTGVPTQITPAPVGPSALCDIALADSATAYVTNQADQGVYRVNLGDGSFSLVTTLPSINITNLALKNNSAYVVGEVGQTIYAVDLLNGSYVPIPTTISPGTRLSGIGVINNTAYVVTYNAATKAQNRLYTVDLATGSATLFSEIAELDAARLNDLAISENNFAYTVGADDSKVYGVNLETGVSFIVTPMPVGTVYRMNGLLGIGVFIPPPVPPSHFISTAGLTSNLLVFANYLNANAPESTLSLFNSLSGSELNSALESAIPTRNGFATFAAQNGYLASAQVVTDHLLQKRIQTRRGSNQQTASLDHTDDCLYASRKLIFSSSKECPPRGTWTGWLGPFGEYAHEKKQSQTPAFHAALGGAVAGADYTSAQNHVFGVGLAYAYTHLDQNEGMGQANVNQAFLGTYSLLKMAKWYLNLGVWGGYYHVNSHRTIALPGFHQTARSNTHGWQLAPHLELSYDGYFPVLCEKKWFGIEPFILGDWVANWQHGYSEHGASPLNMQQKGDFSSLFRGETGLRFQEIVTCNWGAVIFQEKGSYAYQKMFNSGQVTAVLVGSPGSFTVSTLNTAQNLGVVELSINFVPSNPSLPYVDLRYQGEFGSMYQSHQGIVEIGKDF